MDEFLLGLEKNADKKASAECIWSMQCAFNDVFTEIGCFKGTFSLQVKEGARSYQAPLSHAVYMLQKPFKDDVKRSQKQQVIVPLGMDERSERYSSFILVPNPNRKVRLYLDPTRHNQELVKPEHKGPTTNDIFPKLYALSYTYRCHFGIPQPEMR